MTKNIKELLISFYFSLRPATVEHILIRSVLHFVNDTNTLSALASLRTKSNAAEWLSSWQNAERQHALTELNEWALRNNEYPMPPFSDSRSDNRSFPPLTFGQLPKAQMPINPGNRGSTPSDLHPFQPPKLNWFNDGVRFHPLPPHILYKYTQILLSSNLTGLLNAGKRCSMLPIR